MKKYLFFTLACAWMALAAGAQSPGAMVLNDQVGVTQNMTAQDDQTSDTNPVDVTSRSFSGMGSNGYLFTDPGKMGVGKHAGGWQLVVINNVISGHSGRTHTPINPPFNPNKSPMGGDSDDGDGSVMFSKMSSGVSIVITRDRMPNLPDAVGISVPIPVDPRPGVPRPKDKGIKTQNGKWVELNETVSPGGSGGGGGNSDSGGNSGESLYSAGPGQPTINDVASLIDHLLQGEAAHETIDDVSSLIDSMLKQ